MSNRTYLEAIEYVLESEMEARDELIVFRPGAKPAFEEDDRDVALPRIGTGAFSVALGAAMYGMHPVLDMRQEKQSAGILPEALSALPADVSPNMTIIVHAEEAESLSGQTGMRLFAPITPRQAAGFTRAALRCTGLTLLAADQTLYGMEDEVPDECDFLLLPLEEAGVEAPEEEEGTLPEEDGAGREMPEEEEGTLPQEDGTGREMPEEEGTDREASGQESGKAAAPSMRAIPVAMNRLKSVAEELDVPVVRLIGLCMKRAAQRYGAFGWSYDQDALPGECAYLSAEEAVSVWIGCDMLTIRYDAGRMGHDGAAAILRGVKRLMEQPTLLIYDKEMGE